MQELERVQQLGDHALIEQLAQSAKHDRQHTVRLLAELGEVHARGLFRDLGFSSMFDYLTRKLGMSEAEAALRLRAAKLGRAFPVALELLGRSELNLTTLSLLAPLLTADNALELLQQARFKSKQRVLELVAKHAAKPDVPDGIRRSPRPSAKAAGVQATTPAVSAPLPGLLFAGPATPHAQAPLCPMPPQAQGHFVPAPAQPTPHAEVHPRSVAPLPDVRLSPAPARTTSSAVVPLSSERYKITFTASQRLRDMLEHVRDLRRHRYPAGDLEPLFERALELLVADEQRRRFAHTDKPRTSSKAASAKPHSRYIPNAVRRQVWARDEGRCCFRGPDNERCGVRGPLEFHHVVPFARAGAHTADNVVLLCRTHNALLAERDYGRDFIQAAIAGARGTTPAAQP